MTKNMPALAGGACAAGAAALALGGCIEFLAPGDHGAFRYFGEVNGEAPLPMVPPVTDRDGNAYVLYGAPDRPADEDFEAFAGDAHGGWHGGCDILRKEELNFGARTWIGSATSRAWYWAGEGIVEMTGRTGSCQVVLPRDPATQVRLIYTGVIPRVYETPSRTFLHALVEGGGDRIHATIDLDRDDYAQTRPFEPEGASNVLVLGTGADPDRDLGFLLVSYEYEGERRIEGIYLNRENEEVGRATVEGVSSELRDSLGHAAVHGELESVDGNLVAGYLAETGDVVLFEREGGSGTIQTPGDMSARGVHRWEDELYVVGESAGDPQIAPISGDGEIGTPIVWEASARAAGQLSGQVAVLDDRREPRRTVTWDDPVAASSEHPFVQPWSPHEYATGTTAWLLAGPSFESGGGIARTSVAYGPMGISYP